MTPPLRSEMLVRSGLRSQFRRGGGPMAMQKGGGGQRAGKQADEKPD
ncbi:hypothetical protein Mal15_12120 [Stieleria maiorica]|uniref:Uncharacterized protein n=1 Tax=Stieleria maiorica TaxID=2795974 RepID=A0A5B9MC42_9BACT|nr:hypothetical protein Mal15_12120 [Stieleria maiorica]